jgi:FkbM family methyltransferase
MDSFKSDLEKKILQSLSNNFGIENYDEYRYGKYPSNQNCLLRNIKKLIKKIITLRLYRDEEYLKEFETNLQFTWERVDDISKKLLISILAYRMLGYEKVKLPLNNPAYWQSIEIVKTLKDPDDTYNPHFLHFNLEKFDLRPIGYDIKLYFSDIGIVIDFIFEQYAYNQGNTIIQAEKGDYILDVGGCWGDTALYFAHKVGATGKVFSFEFIPNNIKLYNINASFNPNLSKNIHLITNPVSNNSEEIVYYKDNGPSSVINMKPFYGQTGSINTISIDDFIEKNNIDKVDFIKMDIEGSEQIALQGAIKTIKKFRPKLAVAIYHSMEDFANIPKSILDLNLNYEIFIGHYTIHNEETICFAKSMLK